MQYRRQYSQKLGASPRRALARSVSPLSYRLLTCELKLRPLPYLTLESSIALPRIPPPLKIGVDHDAEIERRKIVTCASGRSQD